MTPVELRKVVDAMDLPSPTWEAYLDPDSGEVITVTDEDRTAVAAAEPDSDWRQDVMAQTREALEGDHFLMLPDQYDIHEWSIMKRFALTQRNADRRQELLAALHGPGAWRQYITVLDEQGLTDAWNEFRNQALEQVACDWLSQHGLTWR